VAVEHLTVAQAADVDLHATIVAVKDLEVDHHPDTDELGQLGPGAAGDPTGDLEGAHPRGQGHDGRAQVRFDLEDVREAGRPLKPGGQLELPAVVDGLAIVGDDICGARADFGPLPVGPSTAIVVLVDVGVEDEDGLAQFAVGLFGDVIDHVAAVGQLGGVRLPEELVGAPRPVGAHQVPGLGDRHRQHQRQQRERGGPGGREATRPERISVLLRESRRSGK
jgi:hypothetical protein